MLNILINAYAVSPSWGSEPGMGWNWVTNLAKHCKVHVVTEGEWKEEIEAALKNLPQKDNIIFYYNPVSEKIRKMCWNQGDWRFYWYYRKWQQKTLKIAEEIIAHHQIDVIHQLNMIGFREPGYLWKIKNIPYVWGPIGGMGNIPLSYLNTSGFKQNLYWRIKNIVNDLQIRYSIRVKKALKRGVNIAAVREAKDVIEGIYNIEVPLINETGCYLKNLNNSANHFLNPASTFTILWVGKFDFRKRLDIALRSLSKLDHKHAKLVVCGTGSEEQIESYKNLAQSLDISKQVCWRGKVDNIEVKKLMATSDLFLFTSVSDATSTVVLEAIEAGLPVLSFNACGFGPIVNSFAGKTVELSTPEQSIIDFAREIDNFIENPEQLEIIRNSIEEKRNYLSWDHKAKQLIRIYQSQILQNLFTDGIDAKDTLYIIGNGFDLTHGIKSGYSNFREWVGKSKEYSDLVDLMDIFFSHQHDFWSETEVALGEYDEDQIIDYCKPLGEIDYDHPTRYIAGVEDGPDCLFIPSVEELQDAFRDWVNSIDITNGQRVLKIASESKFLTFNYTETLETVYGVPEQNVLHIHGSRLKKDSHYVFGHCNHRSLECCGVDEEFYDKDRIVRNIRKTMNDCAKHVTGIISQNEKFFEGLTGIKQVIVLGHSLGKVDWPYFEKVQSMVNPSARWIFTYYSDADKAAINDFITNGGISHYMIVHSEEMIIRDEA